MKGNIIAELKQREVKHENGKRRNGKMWESRHYKAWQKPWNLEDEC